MIIKDVSNSRIDSRDILIRLIYCHRSFHSAEDCLLATLETKSIGFLLDFLGLKSTDLFPVDRLYKLINHAEVADLKIGQNIIRFSVNQKEESIICLVCSSRDDLLACFEVHM